jgi:hypothetical protein
MIPSCLLGGYWNTSNARNLADLSGGLPASVARVNRRVALVRPCSHVNSVLPN